MTSIQLSNRGGTFLILTNSTILMVKGRSFVAVNAVIPILAFLKSHIYDKVLFPKFDPHMLQKNLPMDNKAVMKKVI